MPVTYPNRSNRASEVLSQCLNALEVGQAEVKDFTIRFPDYAELRPLLIVAMAVRQLPHPALPLVSKHTIQQQVLTRYRALLTGAV